MSYFLEPLFESNNDSLKRKALKTLKRDAKHALKSPYPEERLQGTRTILDLFE
jgi:hypothetical protein